jgi:hypothetical protein
MLEAKGRMRPLLEAMPVRLILNDMVGLIGAARYASDRSSRARERRARVPGGTAARVRAQPAEFGSGLGTSERGLARVEATARLERHRPNQLEEVPPPSVWAVLLHQFTSPPWSRRSSLSCCASMPTPSSSRWCSR